MEKVWKRKLTNTRHANTTEMARLDILSEQLRLKEDRDSIQAETGVKGQGHDQEDDTLSMEGQSINREQESDGDDFDEEHDSGSSLLSD